MASGDRFYQLEFRHRPVLHGDVGSLLKIEGLVLGGGGTHAVFLLPEYSVEAGVFPCPVHALSVDEWSNWLQYSDQPEILVQGSLEKVFHRKVRYEISGAVQQKVWVADGCVCMYCNNQMGVVQLTVDHWVPLELGGVNDVSNYLSACRRCNKDKGSEHPREFCKRRDLDYDFYVQYLRDRNIA